MIVCFINCQLTKGHQLPFSSSHTKVDTLFSLLYMDLSITPTSVAITQKYFLSIMDDHTIFTWIFLLKSKDETVIVVLILKSMVKKN